MSRPKEQLACAVARHHFGPVAGELVRLLLIQPGSCIQTLVVLSATYFEKKLNQAGGVGSPVPFRARVRLIRNAIAVLIQHDLVYGTESIIQPSSKKNGALGPRPAMFDYHLIIDNILCRLRIPLYLGFVRRRYGSVGVAIMRTMFQRGRLTSCMMFAASLTTELNHLSLSVSDAEACLVDMTRCGILRWSCRRFSTRDLKNSPNHANVNVGEKRRRPMDEASDSDSDNNLPILRHDDDDNVDDGFIVVGRGDSCRKVGAPTRSNDVDIWTVCYWHLNREFRNDCCVRVATLRLGNELACRVLRIGLQLALDQEDCDHPSEDFETMDVATEDIQKVLEEHDTTLPMSAFWEAVQILVDQSPSFVIPIPIVSPSKLRFVPGQLIADARRRTLQDIVCARYKPIGRRIFEALAIEGAMDEKMLADRCMVHVKVARGLVYKMYEDKLVNLQEVPRSHDQQRSSNWFYLWNVNLLSALRSLTDVMYTTASNLFLRLESLDVANGSEEEQKRTVAHEQILMGSILRMDQSIMVMRDFGSLAPNYFNVHYEITDGPVGKISKRR